LASGATFHGKGLDNWRGSLWWWPTKLLTQCKNSASLIGPVHGLHQKSCETGVTSGNVQDALSFEVMRSGVCVCMCMVDIAITQFTVHNGMCWGSQRGELHGIA